VAGGREGVCVVERVRFATDRKKECDPDLWWECRLDDCAGGGPPNIESDTGGGFLLSSFCTNMGMALSPDP
jgi:hypothetical protein